MSVIAISRPLTPLQLRRNFPNLTASHLELALVGATFRCGSVQISAGIEDHASVGPLAVGTAHDASGGAKEIAGAVKDDAAERINSIRRLVGIGKSIEDGFRPTGARRRELIHCATAITGPSDRRGKLKQHLGSFRNGCLAPDGSSEIQLLRLNR